MTPVGGQLARFLMAATVACALAGCSGSADAGAEPSKPAKTEKAKPKTLEDKVWETTSTAEALKLLVPAFIDTHDSDDEARGLFVRWSAEHLRWADVEVAKDETTFGLVMKDSAAERGKRICYGARIMQIAKVSGTTGSRPIYGGTFSTRAGKIVHFYAVGSSGALEEGSRARFCGFVTGRYSYANVGGGTTHAISLVGMFDLAENKEPPAAAAVVGAR